MLGRWDVGQQDRIRICLGIEQAQYSLLAVGVMGCRVCWQLA